MADGGGSRSAASLPAPASRLRALSVVCDDFLGRAETSSYSAFEEERAVTEPLTDPRSWLTNTIVLPSARIARTSRSTSPGTPGRRPRAPRRAAGCRTAPGSRSSTRAAAASRTSSSSASGRRTARARRTRGSSSNRSSSSRGVRPSSVPLIRMLSRAVSSGLKPTPSSMNGESAPLTARCPSPAGRCRRGS